MGRHNTVDNRTQQSDLAVTCVSQDQSTNMFDKRFKFILEQVLPLIDISMDSKQSLAHKLSLTPFGRIAIVFDYGDDQLLTKINNIISLVNSKVR